MELPSWTPTWVRTILAKALGWLDYVLDVLRDKLYFLKSVSPTFAPRKWIYINGSCCIFTFMFFLLGWMEEATAGYQFALDWYVPYNLLICVVWFAEAGLWMLFDQASPAWHKLGELALALFFIFDGIVYLYEWQILGYRLERKEILIYTVIDFLIYLFYLMLAIREEAKTQIEALTDRICGDEIDNSQNQDVENSDSAGHKEVRADFKIMT